MSIRGHSGRRKAGEVRVGRLQRRPGPGRTRPRLREAERAYDPGRLFRPGNVVER
ncbi:hypothetical protein ACWEPN_38915 [Nonomuraea wenchangensis]